MVDLFFLPILRVVRPSHQWLMKTSCRNSSATLTTPHIHCTASLSQNSHLFVRLTIRYWNAICTRTSINFPDFRRYEKRIHFDGSNFVVRNESQSAGFDENNLLKVYWIECASRMESHLIFISNFIRINFFFDLNLASTILSPKEYIVSYYP